MRILYIHQYFKLPSHAGGIRSYEMARRLIENGHSVTMICSEAFNLGLNEKYSKHVLKGNVNGIDILQVRVPFSNRDSVTKRTKTFLKFSYFAVKIALKEEYDLIFATSTPLSAGIPGIFAKMFRKKKFVFEVRDLWPELPRALGMKNPFLLRGMDILEKQSYKKADACIGLSPGICEGIALKAQKNKPIELIPNGSDLDIFNPKLKGPIKLDGLQNFTTVAVFTGTHGIANGLDAVLDAAKLLLSKGRDDIGLVFIGDGNTKDSLVKRAKDEKLTNCLFYDPIPKLELNEIVASADIGMMILADVPAFYYGTSPNKFFDYISSGIPILNNYPGWLAEMIKENYCGLVVEPNNPEEFAEALVFLADHPEERRIMGHNSRKLAELEFSRDKLADKFIRFLEKI